MIPFTASRIADLLVDGSGKTKMNYIYDKAAENLGILNDISTKQMQHGINNELYAINLLIAQVGGVVNQDNKGNQISFKVNDYITARPDGFSPDHVLEAKCQYNVYNFFEQKKLPKKYLIQVQTQMMALKVQKGYLINYLTKPEIWGQDEWKEYDIPLPSRIHVHEINQDNEIQEQILQAAENSWPKLLFCIDLLKSAQEIDDMQFYHLNREFRLLKVKDINWINFYDHVYLYDSIFYVKKR